jgi:flagellar hook-associated protein 3 FlgL
MRVADSTTFGSLMFHLQRARARQAETQLQLATLKRITAPSDDPVGFGRIVDYKALLATAAQREKALSLASSQLDETDSALSAATDSVMGRVKELAVSMTNVTNGSAERKAAAEELKGLVGQLLEIANRKIGDRALFTGSTTRGRVNGVTIAAPATGAPVTITGGSNDTVKVKVDGVSSGTITLTAGSYTTGASLAAQVESKINADATLAGTGKAVAVSFDTDHLVITSNASGVSSSVTITGGSARNVLGLNGGTTATGNDPFSLGARASAGARNTGGAIIAPGDVTDQSALTFNDYLIKFTGASAYDLYSANSPVAATANAANRGGGLITKSVVNDTGLVTLDDYEVRVKNVYTVTAGANDGLRFDPGTGPVTATLAAGSYTGAELAAEIKAKMETAEPGAKTYTASFNETTGKFSITNDAGNGTDLSLLYANAASTAKSLMGSSGTDQTAIAAGSTATSDVDTTGAAGVTRQTHVFDQALSTNIFNITSANNTLIINDTAGGAGADTTITLTAGSYTGAQLATELAAKLNASRNVANTTAYIVGYESVTARRLTINNPAGNANSLILKFGDSASTAVQILGSTPVTVTDTVGASATTLNSDAGNSAYASGGAIDFDGLRVAITDGGTAVRNGDVFSVVQNATRRASGQFTSGASIAFDGIRVSIDATGAGAGAPGAGDRFHVLTTHLYNGDATDATVEVGDGVTAPTLVNGRTVFAGASGGTDVFTALQGLATAFLSNNVDGIEAAHAAVSIAANQVQDAQGTIGARSNRLLGVKDGLSQFQADIQTLLSNTEDVDFAKAASDLALQQVTLQAAAQSMSSLLQTSLLNFLR